MKGGNKSRQIGPRIALFAPAGNHPYVRLIYRVRQSQEDHNRAVVAAEDLATLGDLTRRVQFNPDDGCKEGAHGSCSWVPGGIAVRPEQRRLVDGEKRWTPVA